MDEGGRESTGNVFYVADQVDPNPAEATLLASNFTDGILIIHDLHYE